MNRIRLVGKLDANFGWTGAELRTGSDYAAGPGAGSHLRGAFAWLAILDGTARVVRDPLGVGKLFWGIGRDGALLFSARPWRLVEAGCGFGEIRAVPPGRVIDIGPDRGEEPGEVLPAPRRSPTGSVAERPVEELAGEIRATLERYCAAIAQAHPRARVFVCLSGGLDSTGVAVLARRHFRDVWFASFDLRRPDGSVSADRRTAERLAADMGLPLLAVTPSGDEMLEGLDDTLREAIDWRDFNVHAGLVNLALASGIAAVSPGPDTLVLTGDFPNEYLVDYHAEVLGGQTYYALPQLPPTLLQAALVRGLETSHREGGPFQAFGLPVVQVYGPAVDHYLALSAQFLADPQRKERLCRMIFGGAIPEYVYSRPKTRAQIGDPEGDGGVLGACLARGIDAQVLRRRFAELHGTAQSALDRFIRGGRYLAAIPRLAAVA